MPAAVNPVAGISTPQEHGASAPIKLRFFYAYLFMVGCLFGQLWLAAPCSGSTNPDKQSATLSLVPNVGGYPNLHGDNAMCLLTPVQFHSDTIYITEYKNKPYTPMKPIVKNMGLDWMGQYAKLKNNPERWGIEIISIPSKSGDQNTICLPLHKISGWMSTISPNKCKPEIRDTIIRYQNECDDVLYKYWMGQQKPEISPLDADTVANLVRKELENLPQNATGYLSGEQQMEIMGRIKKLKLLFNPISDQYNCVAGIEAALMGKHPNTRMPVAGYLRVLKG